MAIGEGNGMNCVKAITVGICLVWAALLVVAACALAVLVAVPILAVIGPILVVVEVVAELLR